MSYPTETCPTPGYRAACMVSNMMNTYDWYFLSGAITGSWSSWGKTAYNGAVISYLYLVGGANGQGDMRWNPNMGR